MDHGCIMQSLSTEYINYLTNLIDNAEIKVPKQNQCKRYATAHEAVRRAISQAGITAKSQKDAADFRRNSIKLAKHLTKVGTETNCIDVKTECSTCSRDSLLGLDEITKGYDGLRGKKIVADNKFCVCDPVAFAHPEVFVDYYLPRQYR